MQPPCVWNLEKLRNFRDDLRDKENENEIRQLVNCVMDAHGLVTAQMLLQLGSSAAMEADIIAEGFREGYVSVIGDDDRSVMATIQQAVPLWSRR